ncbi:KpsF/GutQ family sugar-phosphate isomerase [Helicobacter monodelphidis]|uniref:KpsF/GutQ family sugar-phosphate isomerase n=1 Tax=Helicobacter sp. 15-1451 TaxID=2004995 RepID=UPI000DCBD6CE|nr:KpsF/GutQ family sugar-phosphate isomerase [Helicobacter sp. 15-1451]RAX56684.1 KpsF/GutQ family sugar-phosphate isomerase [Helicobacter sp. 15-1451]
MYLESFLEVLRIESQALQSAELDENEIQKAIDLIEKSSGKLVISGVGKSGLIAAKIAATLASTGTPSFFIHPTEAMHGDLGMLQSNDIFCAISYSGETNELIAILPHLKRLNIPLITMSCSKNSSLSQNCDAFLSIRVKQEACPLNIAPSASTTLTLALGDALAITLMKRRNFTESDFASFHPGGSLGRRLFVSAKDIMRTKNLPIVEPELPLKEAIVIMSNGCLGNIILARNNQLCGVLSDGDLRRAMMRQDFSLESPVQQYATLKPSYCDDSNRLAIDILEEIESKKIQFLVITDKNRLIQGVIHLHHLLEAKIKQ